MITLLNTKSIQFIIDLFHNATRLFDENKQLWFTEHYNLNYYKVAIQWANTFNDLGLFKTVDDVIYYLEKPHKFQELVYVVKSFELNYGVYKGDYTQWLKDIKCPKKFRTDVEDVITYILENNYSIHWLSELIQDLQKENLAYPTA